MNFGLVFFQFLPLLLYIAFEYWKGFRAGIFAAILGAIGLVAFNYFRFGTVDQFSLGECGLILLMGVISLKMNNERFFKFQPTVLAGCIVIVFVAFEIKGTPLLVRYVPQMERLFDAENQSPEVKAMIAQMHTPEYTKLLAKLSRACIFLFLGHGLLMAYAAMFLSTPKWFFWRMMIYPGLFLTVIIVGLGSLR